MATAGKRGKSRAGRVNLAASLVIASAAELHAQLCAVVAAPGAVVLDASAVTQIDTAGLQLLQAFAQARNVKAGQWGWENVGDALRDAATQLGVEQMLGLPEVAPVAS